MEILIEANNPHIHDIHAFVEDIEKVLVRDEIPEELSEDTTLATQIQKEGWQAEATRGLAYFMLPSIIVLAISASGGDRRVFYASLLTTAALAGAMACVNAPDVYKTARRILKK